MLDTDFMRAASSVGAPALLTNASALLLGGANFRRQLAISAKAQASGSEIQSAVAANARKRIGLTTAAMHAFHIALIAFGLDCALLLTIHVLGELLAPLRSILEITGTGSLFIGLASLLLGVVLIATEGLYELPDANP